MRLNNIALLFFSSPLLVALYLWIDIAAKRWSSHDWTATAMRATAIGLAALVVTLKGDSTAAKSVFPIFLISLAALRVLYKRRTARVPDGALLGYSVKALRPYCWGIIVTAGSGLALFDLFSTGYAEARIESTLLFSAAFLFGCWLLRRGFCALAEET